MELAPLPLLKTKLFVPQPLPRWVSRPRLLLKLDEARQEKRRLILVSAPPGFGKTSLLSEWVHGLTKTFAGSPVQVAWLSLDQADNDPARFLTYLVAALEPALADPSKFTQPIFQAYSVASLQAVFVQLINVLSTRQEEPFVLVLDDYHLIENETIHESLAFFLENLPPGLQMVIASRADPPFPLARLRAHAQMSELRTADLRFAPAEAADFLNLVMGLGLSTQDLQALENHIEGWIAGLQLTAIAMQSTRPQDNHQEAGDFVVAFTGSHRFILDYLVEEVLQRQPAHVQNFLLCTSILDRFSAPLCEAVLGQPANGASTETGAQVHRQVQSILEYLERSNLFLFSLDHERHWYRYHHLFADFLRSRLALEAPSRVAELHRRAADWYEKNNGLPEAVKHSLQARDFGAAARQIEAVAPLILMRAEMDTLNGWIEALPHQVRSSRPRLLLYHAWAMLFQGSTYEVDRLIQEIDRIRAQPDQPADPILEGQMATIRSIQRFFQGDITYAIELAHTNTEIVTQVDVFSRSIFTWFQDFMAYMDHEISNISRVFAENMQSSQSMGNYLIALLSAYILGYQQNLQGKLSQAEETFRNAIRMAESGFQSRESPVFGVIYIGLADLLRERNQIEAAAKSIDKGLQLGREFNNAEMLVDVLVVQARVQQALGLVESASRTMQQACQLYLDGQVAIWTGRQVATYQARLNIQQNNLEAAWRWADGLLSADYQANSPTGGFSKYVDTYVFCMEGVVLARLNLAAGRAAEAEKWLYEVLRRAASIEWRVCQIEAKALLALAFQAQNKSHVAIQMLQEALQEAAPEGYIRLFIDIGQPMRALLRTVYPQLEPGRLADFAQVLLEAFVKEPAGVSQPEPVADYTNKLSNTAFLVEPLSERETEVLRLLLQGLSNPEIADHLVVAVSTVKTHIHHIYEKLGVTTRAQAIDWAQRSNL